MNDRRFDPEWTPAALALEARRIFLVGAIFGAFPVLVLWSVTSILVDGQ